VRANSGSSKPAIRSTFSPDVPLSAYSNQNYQRDPPKGLLHPGTRWFSYSSRRAFSMRSSSLALARRFEKSSRNPQKISFATCGAGKTKYLESHE